MSTDTGTKTATIRRARKIAFEFPPQYGPTVHYIEPGRWYALCGSDWLDCSNAPEDVTCMECLAKLEELQGENNDQ